MSRRSVVSSTDPTIAGRVRYLRAQRRYSRAHLAILAGVSDGWLSALEQGRIEHPDPTKLEPLARALGTTYLDLMEACGYTALPPIPEDLKELVIILCGLTPARRAKLLKMIYILLEPDIEPPRLERPHWIS